MGFQHRFHPDPDVLRTASGTKGRPANYPESGQAQPGTQREQTAKRNDVNGTPGPDQGIVRVIFGIAKLKSQPRSACVTVSK
jgi:hypothetical protein